jgi:hypothetical protein
MSTYTKAALAGGGLRQSNHSWPDDCAENAKARLTKQANFFHHRHAPEAWRVLYAGQEVLGSIRRTRAGYQAQDRRRRPVGASLFPTWTAARAAIEAGAAS